MANQQRLVALFPTCIVDMIYPEIAEATAMLLERAGVTVVVPPGQTCCGQVAFNSGEWRDAASIARRNLKVLCGWGDVVMPSGSCAAMIRHSYAQLFRNDPSLLAATHELAARTYELTEYLVDILGVTDLGARFNGRITIHDACHGLRGLGLARQPRLLLANVAGAQIVEAPEHDRCCGFGGLFSVKQSTISSAMVARKVEMLCATGADVAVTGDASCMTQINGRMSRLGVPMRVLHIAQLLAGTPKGALQNT
jgi:L-lactate dehydrogenase complex protein LldE